MSEKTEITIDNPPGAKPRPARRVVERSRVLRGYTRQFTPHGETGKRYLLDNIPAGLWTAARAKAKRDGFSMRHLILQLLTEYIDR